MVVIKKGQSKIIVFVILFLISIILLTSSNLWGRGIIQENLDIVKLRDSEEFLSNFEKTVNNLIEYGGSRTVNYDLGVPIRVLGSNIIDVMFLSSLVIPSYWINVSDSSSSYIREKSDGSTINVQLVYSPSEYDVEFDVASSIVTPRTILLTKEETETINGRTVIKIQISFMR